MTEKDWPKVVGTLLASVLLFILMSYVGVTNGFLKIVVVGLLVLSFFADKFGGTGRTIRKIFLAVAAVLFLLSWWFTGPTAKWAQHRTEEVMPRDPFDPRVGEPIAQVLFYERTDGRVVQTPKDWVTNPKTGEPLARPGTTEFLRLLTKYELQQAKEKVWEDGRGPVTQPNLCTYCFGDACKVAMPATILGPGQFQVRNERAGTTAIYTWRLNGKGEWSHPFPDNAGEFEWSDPDYGNGRLRGEEWSTKHPRGKTPLALICPFPVPLPIS